MPSPFPSLKKKKQPRPYARADRENPYKPEANLITSRGKEARPYEITLAPTDGIPYEYYYHIFRLKFVRADKLHRGTGEGVSSLHTCFVRCPEPPKCVPAPFIKLDVTCLGELKLRLIGHSPRLGKALDRRREESSVRRFPRVMEHTSWRKEGRVLCMLWVSLITTQKPIESLEDFFRSENIQLFCFPTNKTQSYSHENR